MRSLCRDGKFFLAAAKERAEPKTVGNPGRTTSGHRFLDRENLPPPTPTPRQTPPIEFETINKTTQPVPENSAHPVNQTLGRPVSLSGPLSVAVTMAARDSGMY